MDNSETVVVELNAQQWAWLVQHACEVSNFPMRIGYAEPEEDDEGPIIVARMGMSLPGKLEGVNKLVATEASFSLGQDTLPSGDAWPLAMHMAKTLHNRCMSQVIENDDFRDFIAGREKSTILTQ